MKPKPKLDEFEDKLAGEARPKPKQDKAAMLRSFMRGISLPDIAKEFNVEYNRVWVMIRDEIKTLHALDQNPERVVMWTQYTQLQRIVDLSFEAYDDSKVKGSSRVKSYTALGAGENGMLETNHKSIERIVESGPGDTKYLDMAMRAMRDIREIFKLGSFQQLPPSQMPGVNIGIFGVGADGKPVNAIRTRWATPAELGMTVVSQEALEDKSIETTAIKEPAGPHSKWTPPIPVGIEIPLTRK